MIYLDNNATTKIDRVVYFRQCEILNKYYGNPSSLHPIGVEVKEMLMQARRQVSSLIGANLVEGDRILFTSCATESNNAVFHSATHGGVGNRIIISSIEHPSIINTAHYYKENGYDVIMIGVDKNGKVRHEELLQAINDNTVLISIGLVNSETGVIQDIRQLTKEIKSVRSNILVHTDAVQGVGKIPINARELGVDFLTLSGHKFYAPKGVGALYIRKGVQFSPFMYGGHQEYGLRPGTENTASIVAMGVAAERVLDRLNNGEMQRIEDMRNMLENCIQRRYDAYIIGKDTNRVGNTCNVGFRNIDGNQLVLQLALKEICVSSGTACNSESPEVSYVLREMNTPKEYSRSIRISLSYDTTESDIKRLVEVLDELI